jgi:hypothetical protein
MGEPVEWRIEPGGPGDRGLGTVSMVARCRGCRNYVAVCLPEALIEAYWRGGTAVIQDRISDQAATALTTGMHPVCFAGATSAEGQAQDGTGELKGLQASTGPMPRRQPGASGATPGGMGRPDFVLFGIPEPGGDGVILFASSSLTQSQLESSVRGLKKAEWGESRRTAYLEDRRTSLAVEMDSFTMMRADTYAGALRSLATVWRPPGPARPQLEQGSGS